ncbi:MAG TPA: hypothetical protein VN257_10865 [Actinotalea sp.]|nr:hypothetical protein [Actinotalea sp.]
MGTSVSQGSPVSPAAVRLRRPGWRDPRLLLGLVLVASSVALGSWLVGSAGRTVPVYAAADPLVAGDPVDPARLAVREVRIADTDGVYLRADEALPPDLVVVRTVGSGELVPLAATATRSELDVRPVAITPRQALSRAVVPGASVDLWFVPTPDQGSDSAAEPRQLAAALAVAEVAEPTGAFAVGSGQTVHVLVPVTDLPAVLAALAADGTVEVVPVPGGSR